jgi:phosphoglycolate phosphatase
MLMRFTEYKHFLWDFNGTLIDDTRLCLSVINHMLARRAKPILSLEYYREIFDFPVVDYYARAGFDFTAEDFDKLSIEFIDGYKNGFSSCVLHDDVLHVLEEFSFHKIPCSVISATEQNYLHLCLKNFEINTYFQHIFGIENHYAHGKLERARELLQKLNCSPEQVTLVGDTCHDAEVAKDLGINCFLVQKGHHSKERLEKCGFTVLNDLRDILHL